MNSIAFAVIVLVVLGLAGGIILVLASTELPKKVAALLIRKAGENNWLVMIVRLVFYAGVFFLGVAYLVDATYNPFLYFRF